MFRGKTFLKLTVVDALLVSTLLAGSALGFRVDNEKWTANRTVVMHLSLGGAQALQDGFTSFNQSAADALSIWNQHLMHLRFTWISDSTLAPAKQEGDNSVFFSNSVFGDSFGSNVLAVTFVWSLPPPFPPIRTEADVIFNTAVSYDSYRGPQQGSTFDFHRVALHEFGHVLGLEHPDDGGQRFAAIMNSRIGSLDVLQEDDIAGARHLHDSGPAYLSPVPAPALVNLSTRAFVGTGSDVLIGGFIVQGSEPATIILRAIGHSLAGRGLPNALSDPMIQVFSSTGALVAENDDWIVGENAATIASYNLDPANSLESAILRTLNPGSYTAVVKSFDNGDGNLFGTALIELYDVHTTGGRAGNISTRGQVLTDNDVMIAGFIIGGNVGKGVVVRALGPSLSESGVATPLSDPRLELRDGNGNLVRENDDWETDPEKEAVRASGLAPTNTLEAALHVNLNPGSYTAITRGFNNGTGTGLVEVYDLSPAP